MGTYRSLAADGTPPPDLGHDPMGDWLEDNDRYFNGEISYAELQRRNCERYRSSPPICGSAKLTDSQGRQRMRLGLEEHRRMGRHHEVIYERLRWKAILSGISLTCVTAVMVLWSVNAQWMLIAAFIGCLILSVLELWTDVRTLRSFDDEDPV